MLLAPRDPLVATFSESRAPSYWKSVTEQAIVMPNWSKAYQTFRWHSSVFALEKQPKNLNFQSAFTPREPLVGTFSETRSPTSRKYVAEQGIVMPNWT